ncbi:hypothetical protein GRF59_15260 [Paenibacillus sp. HJL G12]|uniref:Copper amine oxidase-like N-terminal domain-containing protein n=1 Tax=Paenibacillus dendrobii TaxID=2691084 RepID=A0A7X3IJS0_9BACL|nr:stalk domain-containing protein [Paenibacillus dendrobii]MWV44980.1 hypothetical protein [Paenibacillus dendrobii]
MKKVGYLITGLALGLTISVGSPVVASAVKTISAKVNNTVSVILNGEKVQLKTQPLEYNNLNYLPVGEIGRSLGLDVSYDKTNDAINIKNPEKFNDSSSSQATITPSTPSEQAKSEVVQKLKLGESITKDGLTVKIDKVEYMPDGETVGNLKFSKGFKIHLSISNNAVDRGISNLGSLFTFKTDSILSDNIINTLGNTVVMDVDGNQYKGSILNKSETATGYIYYQSTQSFKIKEIAYYPNVGTSQSSDALGNWFVD